MTFTPKDPKFQVRGALGVGTTMRLGATSKGGEGKERLRARIRV